MRTTTMSRRRLGVAAAALLATAILPACGTGENATQAGQTLGTENVDLRVAWWGGDSRQPITQEAIDAFQKKYPNIKVTGEYADWNGYWDKLATQTAGNNAPDVVQMDELYLASYAERRVLADLGKLSQLDTSTLDPKVLSLGQTSGGQYGMPISTTAFSVFANQDILDKLGVALPNTETWTWEDLNKFAQSITKASGGKIVGVSPMNNGYSLQLWARQNNQALFTDGDISISPEALAGYFALARDWTKSGAAASASRQAESASGSIDQTDFSTGKQALTFSQSAQIPVYEAATGGAKIVPLPLPTNDANASTYAYLKPAMYWSVSAQSKNQPAAAAFVDFMVNSTEAGKILGTDRGIPANPEVRDALSSSLEPGQQRSVEFQKKVESNIGEAPEVTPNGASALDPTIARYLQEVTFERMTPEKAATEFISEIKAAIKQAK
jgi:multiple sugar transport system substrate-binding protein